MDGRFPKTKQNNIIKNNTTIKKGILFIITMATICFAANAQTYTTLGIGIASPNGTLHVHSSENHFLDPPIVPLIRNDFDQYYTILRLSNTSTGVRDTDGFVVTLDNKEVSVSQLENAQFRIAA